MNSITQMTNIMDEMIASGVTPKVKVIRSQKGPKKSIWGVKSSKK